MSQSSLHHPTAPPTPPHPTTTPAQMTMKRLWGVWIELAVGVGIAALLLLLPLLLPGCPSSVAPSTRGGEGRGGRGRARAAGSARRQVRLMWPSSSPGAWGRGEGGAQAAESAWRQVLLMWPSGSPVASCKIMM